MALRESLRAQPYNYIGCALAMLYAVPSLWYPFGSDQGIHWYLGHALLHGQMPYVSGISGKPPLIFVVHALAELLFGNRQSSIRLLELLALPGFGALIAKAVRRPLRPARDGEVGAASLLLSAANYTYQDYWNTAHPEFWMTLCLVAAQCVAVGESRPRRRALWVGALCMIAFLLKYPGAAMAIPIAAYAGVRALYLEGYPPEARRRVRADGAHWLAFLREAAWFLVGAAIVFVLVLLPFVLTGTVREMIEVCVFMTENYASAPGFPHAWYRPLLNPFVQGTFFTSMMISFGAGVALTARDKDKRELAFAGFLLSIALAAVASVVMQKRLFTYHWIACYPFFVALGLWGAREVVARLRARPTARWLLGAVAVWTVAAFVYGPAFVTKVPHTYRQHVASWSRVVFGGAPASDLTMSYVRVAQADRFGDLVHASEYVKARAKPGDALCLTCFISPVYQLTGLRCTTRHAIGSFVPMGPSWWQSEYTRDMHERPPRFAVSITTVPKRNKLLLSNGFREVARFGTVLVFEHVALAPETSAEREQAVLPKP